MSIEKTNQSKKAFYLLSNGAIAITFLAAGDLAMACQATLSSNNTPYTSIGAAFNAAANVDTITVDGSKGICTENIVFGNHKLRINLVGKNGATINSADNNSPVIDARSKVSLIQNINISGGRGIVIMRGTNSTIDSVNVSGSVENGITVRHGAFAVITNSNLSYNTAAGVKVTTLASAHVGFNNDEDGASQGNTISHNGASGISVDLNSTAKITSNSIFSNAGDGVTVAGTSSALLANNGIYSNTGNGISVRGASSIRLAPLASGLFSLPNTSSAVNVGYGINCGGLAYIEGHLGTSTPLNGSLGAYTTSPAATCVNLSSQ